MCVGECGVCMCLSVLRGKRESMCVCVSVNVSVCVCMCLNVLRGERECECVCVGVCVNVSVCVGECMYVSQCA